MRGKRSKQYRKLMQQYGLTFGFREPYQVLIDAQMLQDTSRYKMDIVASLERTLHGQVKPMITQCTMRHLYSLPNATSTTSPTSTNSTVSKTALVALARTFERRRCNHHGLEQPLSTLDCFQAVVDPKSSGTNKNRYVVASQEEDVRRWARGIKGVPSVYVKRSVMVMEPMAETSVGVREGVEREKFRGGVKRLAGVKRKREDAGGTGDGERKGSGEEGERKKRKVRGAKGPNSLSVKKPKKADKGTIGVGDVLKRTDTEDAPQEEEGEQGGEGIGQKRKRRRKHKAGGMDSGTQRDGGGDEWDS